MDFASPAESWAYQRATVAELERGHPDWPGAAGFRRLVEAVAASPAARQLYATRSHLALVVSPVAKYRERVRRPRVVVEPLEGSVRVHRLAVAGRVGVAESPVDAALAAVEAALAWLAIADAAPGTSFGG